MNNALNTLYEQLPPTNSSGLDMFFIDVLHALPNRIEHTERVRKYLFEGEPLPESFPAAHVQAINNYKDIIDSKSESVKNLLHQLFRIFQAQLNAIPLAANNNGSNNGNNNGNNNANNGNNYFSNFNEEQFLNSIRGHGSGSGPVLGQSARKTRKGGKRRRSTRRRRRVN
jgi:hypothetical protein